MAIFTKLNESYLTEDGDWYKLSGEIQEEDIFKINSFVRKTIIVIDNTKGISSDLLAKITSSNITFSVVGGLDYFNKEKYQSDKYIERTMVSPFGLTEIVKYFESIEIKMQPEWTDTQKCMFLYDALVRDFIYEEEYESQLNSSITSRGLNGVLYKKLVCAGFAQVFKEGLDRLGIKNIYQNRKGYHSWNIVELSGKLRGLELTWDCSNKGKDNVCKFSYFGQDQDFYSSKSHTLSREIEDLSWSLDNDWEHDTKKKIIYEQEERQYNLVPFGQEELKADYRIIAPSIMKRTAEQNPLFKTPEEELKMLPVDRLRISFQKQSLQEQYFMLLYFFLKKNNKLDNNQYGFLSIRWNYLQDVLGTFRSSLKDYYKESFSGREIGIDYFANCNFSIDGSYETPFGSRNVSFRGVEERIDNIVSVNQMFVRLKEQLDNYLQKYLNNLLNSVDILLVRYDKFKNLKVQKDLNLALMEDDLYTKLQSLMASKEYLYRYGNSREIIDEKMNKVKKYFSELSLKNAITEEEKKENDYDFLYGVFANPEEVREFCEKYEGRHFTDEEWSNKCTNVDYYMKVFDRLPQLNIKREYIKNVLNEVFLEQKSGQNSQKM